jgi:hypothetical protein
MTTKEGKKYRGEFKLAVPDGFGIKTWPDGSTYKGLSSPRQAVQYNSFVFSSLNV